MIVKAFRQHYNEKPVVFRERLARRVQQPGDKLTDFCGDLQTLALKTCPHGSNEIGEHLKLRGIFEGIESSQVRLNLRWTLGDANMTLDKVLERALHIETVTRIEEGYNEPPVSAVQSNENTQLVNSIKDLVRTLQTDQSNRQDNEKFFLKERGQRSFYAERSEVQQKPEIEIETIIAITEAALIIVEPITARQ